MYVITENTIIYSFGTSICDPSFSKFLLALSRNHHETILDKRCIQMIQPYRTHHLVVYNDNKQLFRTS